MTPEALAARLPDWSRSTAPSVEMDYAPLIPTAVEIVQLSSAARRQLVMAYAARYCAQPLDYAQCSKLYLLLRVIFELPRELDRAHAAAFGGWVHPGVFDDRPTFDVSWPVRVDAPARRMAISPCAGYLGSPYLAALEYDWFAASFPLRSPGALSQLVLDAPLQHRR
jgi:hypothetical protein